MITQYHRPSSLDEALELLSQSDTFPLGGGTSLTSADNKGSVAVVDLQSIGLGGIDSDGATLTIGATCALQDLVESADIPPLVRDLAHREAPNTIRNAATLGGTIATADPESELLAGLLVFDTTVFVTRTGGTDTVPLENMLQDLTMLEGAIITAVSLEVTGTAVAHRTARTPADRPIVAVVGRRTTSGETLIAGTGLTQRPSRIDPNRLDSLEPPPDFRGSSGYRSRLAAVLTARVIEDLDRGTTV